MRHFYFISFLLLFLISCEKEDTPNTEIPDWLQPRIEELENSEQCHFYSISRDTYKNQFYYDILNIAVNCILCEVYDAQGNLVEWGSDVKMDFLNNRKGRVGIWHCPNSE